MLQDRDPSIDLGVTEAQSDLRRWKQKMRGSCSSAQDWWESESGKTKRCCQPPKSTQYERLLLSSETGAKSMRGPTYASSSTSSGSSLITMSLAGCRRPASAA